MISEIEIYIFVQEKGHIILPPNFKKLELKILELMLQGYSDETIAKILDMGTVRDHIKLTLKKLDAKSKADAVIKAISLNLIKLNC